MGPRRIRRGKQSRRPATGRARWSFNGATANPPWKTAREFLTLRPGKPASMGPRRIRRGKPSPPRAAGGTASRFNGATANPPWKTARRDSPRVDPCELQWGHGESAVENHLPAGLRPDVHD